MENEMTENLEDTVLDDGVQTDAVAVSADVAADVPADVSTPTEPTVKVRKRAGRKVDTTGKTALGKARLLYAANPGLSTKQLKQLFLDNLTEFKVSPQVAQTYVSYVRKDTTATA